jgi:hypothetical protein
MNNLAMTAAVEYNYLRPDDNLKIAIRRKAALNIRVDLSRSQTSHQKLAAWDGGIAP